MPLFKYKARNNHGESVTGTLEAPSADAVASQLINTGVTPITISESQEKSNPFADIHKRLTSRKPDDDDLLLFCRQMYTLIKAGVPLVRGLHGLSESTHNQILADIIRRMRMELESGRELSMAMSQYPSVFSPLMISMIRVGENTGQMEDAFLQLSSYIELERDTRARIKTALRYPSMVLIFVAGAIAIVNVFVIPAFAGVFRNMGAELPWQTQLLVAVSDFTVNYGYYILAALVGLVFAIKSYVRTEKGEYNWDKLKLDIPLVGSIILRSLLARFSRTFSMTTRSGVPLVESLSIVARAVDNKYVGERINNMRNGVERGDTLTRTAAATSLFTPLILQMLAVGEETGAVEQMMDEVAGFYEREVDYELKTLSSAIEPILIVAMGILVLVLALGIFLPMWELSSVANH